MTVVNPKSISGINSITTGSGSDNLLTIHTSDASSTERVRINSSGDVIVGSGITVSPDGDIFATGVTTATTFVGALTGNVTGNISGGTVAGSIGTFTGNVDIADTIVHTGDTNTKIRFPSADTVSIEVAGSEGFKVDANGTTVTTTTDASLFINTTNSNGSHVRFQTSGTNKTFLGQAAGISGSLGGANDFAIRSAEDIVFSTNDNNTPNLKIDTSGRVMIGSAAYIGGAALAVLGTSSTPNTYGSLAIGKVGANPTSGTTLANIRLNGGSVGTGRGAEINAIADANWSDGSSHPTYLTFSTVASSSTSATERIRVHAGGNVDIKTGNLVIGTSGKGIDFSATGGPTNGSGTSELFDDYEEGTFSPGVNGGTTNTQTFDSQGRYTKIGRQVYCQFLLQYSGAGNGAHVSYSGLPFTSVNNSSRGGGTVLWTNIPFDTNDPISVVVNGNDTTIYLYYQQDSNLTSGSGGFTNKAMYVRITYEAA